MIQSILVVSPPQHDFIHHQTFFDIALSFAHSLRDLGQPCEVFVNPADAFGKTLVFGAHMIPAFGGTIEGGDYVIFNLEQHDSEAMNEGYLDILRRYEVWDYSRNNIEFLLGKGVNAKLCEIGYHPCMSNIRLGKSATITGGATTPSKVQYVSAGVGNQAGVFDILFYGSINERRAKVIDALKATGKNVVNLVGYGAYRDKYISRAKIVLNMHYWDAAIFEIVRVSHLLANEKCVVSEYGKEPELEAPYWNGVAFSSYDKLVDTCLALLEDDELRTKMAKAGFDALRARKQAEFLKGLL